MGFVPGTGVPFPKFTGGHFAFTLAPVLTNQKKYEEDFHFYEKSRYQTDALHFTPFQKVS